MAILLNIAGETLTCITYMHYTYLYIPVCQCLSEDTLIHRVQPFVDTTIL